MSQWICAKKYDEALFGASHHMQEMFLQGDGLVRAGIID
jgi:hypothetical protein